MNILLLNSVIIPTQAIEYTFDEDFSDTSLSEWLFRADDWSNTTDGLSYPVTTNHTFEVIDGYLVSVPPYDKNIWNLAMREYKSSLGAWRLNASIPIDTDFTFFLSDVIPREQTEPVFGPSRYTYMDYEHTQTLRFFIGSDAVNTQYSTFALETSLGMPDPEPKYDTDTFRLYDFVRIDSGLKIYIDHELVLDVLYPPSENSREWNYLGIVTETGSNVRIDSIRHTHDHKAVLAELNPPQNSDSSNLLYPLLGVIVVGLTIGTILYNRMLKKKNS